MEYILFHHSFEKLAGTERVLYNIMEYLTERKDGKITLLLASSAKPPALNLDHFPIEIVYLDLDITGAGFKSVLSFHLKLYKKLLGYFSQRQSTGKQVYLATNPMLAALAYYAGKQKLPKDFSVVSCEHFALEVSGGLSKVIRKVLYKHVSVVSLTKRDQQAIIAQYHPPLCVCIPNAIPFDPKPYEYRAAKKTILAIGRLTPQKGFDLLIHAFKLIADKHPDWQLEIVGDDYGDQPMLEDLIKTLNLSNVRLLPATRAIDKHYEAAAFFALSSRFEGLPMVVLEAMGHGLPVVAFDCPTGPAELVNDENGFLVSNGNVAEFAAGMERLITDQELLLKKASGAEARAQHYTREHINKHWAALFDAHAK